MKKQLKRISVIKTMLVVSISVIGLVFTGCAGTADTTDTTDAVSTTDTTGTGDSEESSPSTVTVTDVKGPVEIPGNPERIVDLSGNSDILSILGYKVIGTANSDAYDYTRFPTYLEDILEGATILGYSMQDTMDVEAVMNLEPDLIVISTVQEKMYDQLSNIAPTIMIQLEALDWKEDIKALGKVLGKEEEANSWIGAYEQKSKATEEVVKEKYGSDTTYLAFLASGGQFYIFDGAGIGNVLYQDVGLSKPEGMPGQSDISLPVVTYEGLAAIQSDYIFAVATEEDLKALEENTIWNSMEAVKNNKVINLDASPYFNQGYSPVGREILLDKILEMLNGTEQ